MTHVISPELGYKMILHNLLAKIKQHEDILRELHDMKRQLKGLDKEERELEDARIRAESELELIQKQKKEAYEKDSKLLFDKVQWPTHESPDIDSR